MENIRVVACGTKVKTTIGQISALVTGISLREGRVAYEISYFHNGEHKSAWLERYEFELDMRVSKPPGLVNYEQPPDEYLGTVPLLEH